MLKEKKATVVHKGLCERNLGLGLVSFLSCFYFIYLYLGTWEWPGTRYVAATGTKLMNLLLRPPEMILMHHHTRHRIVV